MEKKVEALALVIFLLCWGSVFVSCKDDWSHFDPKAAKKIGKEKVTRLHFFFHDTPTSSDPTTFEIAEATVSNQSATGFGTLFVADDPLTVGADPASRSIGRAQGIFALASKEEFNLLFGMYFYFTEGKYNGSSVSIFGMNRISQIDRELSVVGGTGVFRLARGFALTKLYSSNSTTRNAIVEYWLTILHY